MLVNDIYIWGAGYYGVLTALDFEKKGLKIKAFIDVNAIQIKTRLGLPVLEPAILLSENSDKPLVVISVKNRSAIKEITKYLQNAGFKLHESFEISDFIDNNLYNFFAKKPHKAEKFMMYIYNIIVKEGDCVIDVGANHGLHTIPLSELVGEAGVVLACEAIENNINDIKNKTNAKNILFYCSAITKPDVAKHIKEISFNYFPNKDGYSGIMKRPDVNDKEILVTVPTATLDKLVMEQKIIKKKQISFIKVDTEGGDFDVLLGAENILKKYRPVVIFENGRQFSADLYNYTKEQFFQYFEKIGYVMFQFTGGIFQKEDWNSKNIYFETWLVHKDSAYLNFFKNNYVNLANMYMEETREPCR